MLIRGTKLQLDRGGPVTIVLWGKWEEFGEGKECEQNILHENFQIMLQ